MGLQRKTTYLGRDQGVESTVGISAGGGEPGLKLMNGRRLGWASLRVTKSRGTESEGPLATCDVHSRRSTTFPQYVAEKNLLGHPRREPF